MKRWFVAAACAASLTSGAYTLHSGEGDGVRVTLSSNIVLNGQSSLRREFHVVRDASAPVEITGEPGITVAYNPGDRGIGGAYQYLGSFGFNVREPVVAVEYVAVVFDVFGHRVQTLKGLEVADWLPGSDYRVHPRWRVFSEAAAKEAFGSLVYVSAVRTKSGKVYTADLKRIAELARKVSTQIKDVDLVSDKSEK